MKRGQKQTDIARLKMSIAKKGRAPWNKGKKGVYSHSEKTKMKIRESNIGKHANERSGNWKGDAVGYQALHTWLRKEFGHPIECEECGKLGRFERNRKTWNIQYANIIETYRRVRSNFKMLCRSCHMKFDYSRGRTRRS